MKHARLDYQRIQDPAGLIPEDEPVFLLRAQDATAPATIREWVRLQRMRNDCAEIACELATRHVAAMEIWQWDHGCKTADVPQ